MSLVESEPLPAIQEDPMADSAGDVDSGGCSGDEDESAGEAAPESRRVLADLIAAASILATPPAPRFLLGRSRSGVEARAGQLPRRRQRSSSLPARPADGGSSLVEELRASFGAPPPGAPDYDPTLHSARALLTREALRFDPEILTSIARFWSLAAPLAEPDSGDLPFPAFQKLHGCMYRALHSEWDPFLALQTAVQDWEVDSRGREAMPRALFARSVFQVSDTWTSDCSLDQYASFLGRLYGAISKRDPATGRDVLRPVQEVSIGACASPSPKRTARRERARHRELAPLAGSFRRGTPPRRASAPNPTAASWAPPLNVRPISEDRYRALCGRGRDASPLRPRPPSAPALQPLHKSGSVPQRLLEEAASPPYPPSAAGSPPYLYSAGSSPSGAASPMYAYPPIDEPAGLASFFAAPVGPFRRGGGGAMLPPRPRPPLRVPVPPAAPPPPAPTPAAARRPPVVQSRSWSGPAVPPSASPLAPPPPGPRRHSSDVVSLPRGPPARPPRPVRPAPAVDGLGPWEAPRKPSLPPLPALPPGYPRLLPALSDRTAPSPFPSHLPHGGPGFGPADRNQID